MKSIALQRTSAMNSATSRRSAHILEVLSLIAAMSTNWLIAALSPSQISSWTSLALFGWLTVLLLRLCPRGAVLLLPLMITRFATILSLVAIEAGAYVPEVDRQGSAGDASASFLFFTGVFFLAYAAIFRRLERPFTTFAASPLLDKLVKILAWPVILLGLFWALLAFKQGLSTGFPLFEGIDRFYYRRYYSNTAVLTLLDNKNLVSALLGVIVFSSKQSRSSRIIASATFSAMTLLYYLFGDKFFTIITECVFFFMPFLLQRSDRLLPTLIRATPIVALPVAVSLFATVYIYSDYGRLPLERGMQQLSDRIAGQGELWFVASRDFRQVTNWNDQLVGRYVDALKDDRPPSAAFASGVETYFFIQRYSPAKFSKGFRSTQGWVQLTMGYEAMALVMFGYVGVFVLMAAAGLLVALSALYLERAFISGFPLSLFFAVWTYLQIYFSIQQASLWTVAAPGQVKRLLLFLTIEALLLALNRVTPRLPKPMPRAFPPDSGGMKAPPGRQLALRGSTHGL